MLQCDIKPTKVKGQQYMNLNRKNIPLFIISILGSGILITTLCSPYCVSSAYNLDTAMGESCLSSYYSFINITIVLSALFILWLAGLFVARQRQIISLGFYWPLFKPPRFSHWTGIILPAHLMRLNFPQQA